MRKKSGVSKETRQDKSLKKLPIGLRDIEKMIWYYRGGLPNGGLLPNGKNDTTSAWISAEEINRFMNRTTAAGNISGLRIYFGKHLPNDKNYPYQRNIILVSTVTEDPNETATYANSIDQLNPIKNKSAFLVPGDYEGMGDDAIPLCPSNCPPDTL